MTISSKILNSLSATKPAVNIEKASVDAERGVAKVLFSTNLPPKQRRDALTDVAAMEDAFDKHLNGKAHVDVASIHPAEVAGYYYAFVKLNRQQVALEDATREGSAYHLVAANCFADENDLIWEVKENAEGQKVIMRNIQDDLSDLLQQKANPNMAVASTIDMGGALEFASRVAFFDIDSEKVHYGVALDTSNVFDFDAKKAKSISASQVVVADSRNPGLARELTKRMGETKTFDELAAAEINDVYDYLNTLYGSAPVFLAAYKDAVSRLMKI